MRHRVLALAFGLLACRPQPPLEPAPAAAPLLETRRASVDDLCSPEVRAWVVLDDEEQPVAISRGACVGMEATSGEDLWHFVAQLQAVGAERPTWELHTWLDAFGRPRRADFRTPTRVSHYAWQGNVLELSRLGDHMTLEGGGELWLVPTHGLYLRELMLRLGIGVTADGVVQRSVAPESDQTGEVALRLDASELVHGGGRLELHPSEDLANLRIGQGWAGERKRYAIASGAELSPPLPLRPLPTYEPPPDLELVPIEVPASGDAPRLSGELVLRRERDVDPSPALLFVSGAGAQDRHGLVPDSSIDMGSHEFHDALARAGYVVLRLDDRGVGGSEIGDEEQIGYWAVVDDARRALAMLAARPEIDPKRIYVMGHGEGALIASKLASEGVRVRGKRRALAGLIMLAAPGRNLRELIYDEIRNSMAGQREAEIRLAVDRARSVHDAALAGADLSAANVGARAWMVEVFAEDPLARLRAVAVPVLALQGDKDFQVSPERDFGPITALLAGKKRARASLIEGVDHLFKPEPGISTPGHYADLERRVADQAIEAILTWLAPAQVEGFGSGQGR